MKTIKIILCFIILSVSFYCNAEDDSGKNDEANTLQQISCDTGYLSDLFTYGSPNTCIESPLFDSVVLAMLTYGQSLWMTTRLKLHQEKLYPNNCSRQNRVSYWDPKISFSFCNNGKLVASHVTELFKAAFTGDYTAPSLSDFMIKYANVSPGYSGMYADISIILLPILFGFNVDIIQDRICVNILTIAGTYMPVGCKYMKEPFPVSIFEQYSENVPNSEYKIEQCNSVYTCSEKARTASKVAMPIVSPIISCIREMLLRLVVSTQVCDPLHVSDNTSKNLARALAVGMSDGSVVHKFQYGMHKTVSALLTLYVILFGIKIGTGSEKIKQKDIINFLIKFVLVTYFSVGINIGSGGDVYRFDGMTNLIFPFMLNGVTEIANWFMVNTSNNGLCEFPSSLYGPDVDMNMSLWDQLDCRLTNYLGIDGIIGIIAGLNQDPVAHPIPPFIFLILPGAIMGNLTLVGMALAYPIMIISFIAYALCMFISALILILILGILAPIFVPFALFDVTKPYFDKWWKNLLSLVIQPAVAITFMSLMFAIYDRGFYGTCVYRSVNLTVPGVDGAPRQFRSFFISLDSRDYTNQEQIARCTGSLGYFLNAPGKSIFGGKSGQLNNRDQQGRPLPIDINPRDPDVIKNIPNNDTDYLNGKDGAPKMEWQSGIFTRSPKIFWEDLVNLIKNFIVCFILLSVMKELNSSITQFILSISGGDIMVGGNFDSGSMANMGQQFAQNKVMQSREKIKTMINKGKESLK